MSRPGSVLWNMSIGINRKVPSIRIRNSCKGITDKILESRTFDDYIVMPAFFEIIRGVDGDRICPVSCYFRRRKREFFEQAAVIFTVDFDRFAVDFVNRFTKNNLKIDIIIVKCIVCGA